LFTDEEYQRLYNNEQTTGLLGLVLFATEQRRREIGVRKVIGAGVSDIVFLLSGDILRPVLLASVIASPLAWLAMHCQSNSDPILTSASTR
jgi:ABC-type antimicrobial peptide transport system permease subunit